MKQKAKETIGYFVNGLSITLFIYLAFTLDVPDFLRPLSYFGWILLGCGISLIVVSISVLVSNQGAGLIERGIYGIVRHPIYLGASFVSSRFSSFFRIGSYF